jgi:hypothetical protein
MLLQTPVRTPVVTVGLEDGRTVTIENPEFTGFIESSFGAAVLMYRQNDLHGELLLSNISRIDFGRYERGRPFAMDVTLRNGQRLAVVSEHRNYLMVRGKTDIGTVIIKYPDPISAPLKLSTKRPNRKRDLTIQYLEFPTS